MELKIEPWPLDRLIPYARNARMHADDQVAQIAGSIAEFGFVNPILVGEDGVIIAGHGRLLAARKLGMTEVPVIRLGHLTEIQRRALVIADNRIAENSTWDEDMLRLELEELRAEDFDLDITGFDLDEIDRLLQGSDLEAAGLTDDDEVPEAPEEAITKPGDLWLLGEHRLLCGDATVLADVEKVLDGGLADLCFTDSPYNVDYGNRAKDRLPGKDRRILNDNLGEGFEAFLYDACVNILTVTKGGVYMCMSSSELHTLKTAFAAAGGHWSTFVIWAKNRVCSRASISSISAFLAMKASKASELSRRFMIVSLLSGAVRASEPIGFLEAFLELPHADFVEIQMVAVAGPQRLDVEMLSGDPFQVFDRLGGLGGHLRASVAWRFVASIHACFGRLIKSNRL